MKNKLGKRSLEACHRNEVVEKVNVDFDGSRKVLWAFVGRRTKGIGRVMLGFL